MSAAFTAACVQLNSKREIADNLGEISDLVDAAIGAGAAFIALPECTGLLEPDNARLQEKVPDERDHPVLPLIRERAEKTGVWVLIGSLAVRTLAGKIANRSYLISPQGATAATYDKIHMFDVDLDDGDFYRESATYEPGSTAVLADLPWGVIGLTICYDVRFAYLYRTLAQAGASFLAVPAAFTQVSGEAHWHVLQRARAIETGSYVFAPAQCGTHAEGRRTFGHSLIVDPWGQVLADGGTEPGIVTAEIDPAATVEARRKIPALRHDRSYTLGDDALSVAAPLQAAAGH